MAGIDSIVYGTGQRVSAAAGSVARSASDLVADSGVQATGRKATPRAQGRIGAHLFAALLVVVAITQLGVMRRVFRGAIS